MKKRETAPIIRVFDDITPRSSLSYTHTYTLHTWHDVERVPTADSRLNTAGETKEEKLGVDEKPNRLHENLPWPTGHPRSSQCEPLKETAQRAVQIF